MHLPLQTCKLFFSLRCFNSDSFHEQTQLPAVRSANGSNPVNHYLVLSSNVGGGELPASCDSSHVNHEVWPHQLRQRCHCTVKKISVILSQSSQEHAIYGTSRLLLAFIDLTNCHLSNLRSINLI